MKLLLHLFFLFSSVLKVSESFISRSQGSLSPYISRNDDASKLQLRSLHRSSIIMTKGNNIDAPTIPSSSWNFIDAVYLITTVTNTPNDRLEKTKDALSTVNLLDRVRVRSFKPDDVDRVRGCYTSHISVLQEIEKDFKSKKNTENFVALILEDNLEPTQRISDDVLKSVENFMVVNPEWGDVFHLAYMMYVPGLSLSKKSQNIVQMFSDSGSSVGTSAYIISKSGVTAILEEHNKRGFVEAIPNIMALLFPSSRYAAYPMMFHRAGKLGSLVNPQLDDFRRIMFNPAMYTTWERLMVGTGLQNNQLFPSLLISLLALSATLIYNIISSQSFSSTSSGELDTLSGVITASSQLFVLLPLAVALWGASLFKPGNKGAGFAQKKTE